jgi:hypothetical protein
MATTMWRRQTFSIAMDGLEAMTGDDFTTIMGDLVMDLVSAPIQPGIYTIRLTALMGDIRIFLPAYAKAELQGASFWGGKRIYRNNEFWHQVRAAFAGSDVQVPATPPTWARASYTEYPITLRFIINAIMGRASIYQLELNDAASIHANQ